VLQGNNFSVLFENITKPKNGWLRNGMSKTGMLKGYFKLSLYAAAVIDLPQLSSSANAQTMLRKCSAKWRKRRCKKAHN